MADSVVTEKMQNLLGVEVDDGIAEVPSAGCRLFALAVGHTDPVFFDEAVARARGYRGLVAPPGYLGTRVVEPGPPSMTPVAAPVSANDELEIPYKRRLNGGTAYEYFDSVIAGDVLRSRSKITQYQERDGTIGPMLIIYRETAYTRQDGILVAKMYWNLIHY